MSRNAQIVNFVGGDVFLDCYIICTLRVMPANDVISDWNENGYFCILCSAFDSHSSIVGEAMCLWYIYVSVYFCQCTFCGNVYLSLCNFEMSVIIFWALSLEPNATPFYLILKKRSYIKRALQNQLSAEFSNCTGKCSRWLFSHKLLNKIYYLKKVAKKLAVCI